MFLDAWQNKTLAYDLAQYPWHNWILELIQEIEPAVDDLSRYHLIVPAERIVRTTAHVQKSFSRPEFMQRFDGFAEQYLASLISHEEYMIKRQATLNLVVPDQQKLGRLLPWHQGVWYNNGRGQRTVWMALTNCFDSNSMWVLDHDESCRISKDTILQQWNQEQFENACLESARPCNIVPGQCHLFHQEIMHGNINNTTEVTRMSIDWHVLIKGQEHGRRLPGGFFRFPGDHAQAHIRTLKPRTGFVGYVGNNTDYDRGIPQFLQRTLMDQYCQEAKIGTNCWQFENEYLTWMPILEHLIHQQVPGIVMTSIYSLPDDPQRRQHIMRLALESGVELHFANEYIQLTSQRDSDLIERYRTFAVACSGPHSWELGHQS